MLEQSHAIERARSSDVDEIWPRAFSVRKIADGSGDGALHDPAIQKLLEFFESKGLAALKDEDRREQWYADWIAYQATHKIYASVLSPRQYSSFGFEFNLLRYARLIEVFGYCSASHGYSVQCTFLGLFAILSGTNEALKKEAIAALEAGQLMAFGVSEKEHGSDLLGNEFVATETDSDELFASGKKYYIGNANVAKFVAVLARKMDTRSARNSKRAPFVLCALRPKETNCFQSVRKIQTLGVRAAYVGAFEVRDSQVRNEDIIAQGRDAWDAVFGTVTMGKFFLGIASVGMCEHAMAEAVSHMRQRILYGKRVIDMPHISAMAATAYARLTAMKLFAYRALDYIYSATEEDRRHLLFCAVQKARVSTEGVRVMSILSECVGAKGFESDTFFEMALRDVQLIPGLEGSTHINLSLAAQFIPRYFSKSDPTRAEPRSLIAGEIASGENPYLMKARTGAIHTITFPKYLNAYRPLLHLPNVRTYVDQAKAFRLFVRVGLNNAIDATDMEMSLALGRMMAQIAYGQLVAENSVKCALPAEMVSVMFGLLVEDLSGAALSLSGWPRLKAVGRMLIHRLVTTSKTTQADWDFVASRAASFK